MGANRRTVVVVVSIVAVLAVVVAIALLASNDDDVESSATTAPSSSTPVTTQPATTVPASTAPPTTAAATSVPTTTPATDPPTTPAPATTTPATIPATDPPPSTTDPNAPCEAPTDLEPFNEGFPMQLSGLVGSDIRTGSHECFERVVIEFEGTGDFPGVRVEYVDDPVLLSPSDETVEIEGDATLVVSFGAWMPNMEDEGYDGPRDITPDNVEHILQLRQVENFEGMSAWAIGIDEQRPFSVTLLDAPPRIVIDIAT